MNAQVRALLELAAGRYLDARPWEKLRDEHFFGVEDAETGLSGWASVAGNVGEEYGLGIYVGRDGRKTLEKTLALDLDVAKQDEVSDVVALTMADAQEAKDFRSGTLLDTKRELAGKPCLPIVFRKPPGDKANVLKDKEATFLARALLAVAKTKEWGLDEDDVLDEAGGRLILRLSGPASDLAIDRAYDAPPAHTAVTIDAATEQRLHEAKRAKRLLVRFADGALTFYDPKTKEGLTTKLGENDDAVFAADYLIKALAGTEEKPGILPREIWTDTPSLEAVLAPALAPFGVKVQVKLELKDLRGPREA
jgi:hypothetical protein